MTESAGPLFERLLGIMARLRGPGGCPWDRDQTPSSLKPYLLEEAHEVLEALDARGEHLQEELGDLLFQVVFHSQIAAERGEFTMSDVLRRLTTRWSDAILTSSVMRRSRAHVRRWPSGRR